MSLKRVRLRTEQRGMVLISAMLLLLIITILAVSMFRSFGVQEQVAGNLREKERALHAAEAAEQYAEYWLSNNAGSVAPTTCTQEINANLNQGQICLNTLASQNINPQSVPWQINGNDVGVQYTPPGMNVPVNGVAGPGTYAQPPVFYIAQLGNCESPSTATCYQIDAVGYGGINPTGNSTAAVAVVETTYEIASSGAQTLGGP